MDHNDFIHKINLLENLHKHRALIETEKLEYLSVDGNWKKINVIDLKYMPVSLYVGVSVNDEMSEITYKIKYDLLSPHISLTPSHTESIIFTTNSDVDYPFNFKYQSRLNDLYENGDGTLRYNNKNVNIFSMIKSSSVINDYVSKNRNKLREAIQIVNNDIFKPEIKTYNKSTKNY